MPVSTHALVHQQSAVRTTPESSAGRGARELPPGGVKPASFEQTLRSGLKRDRLAEAEVPLAREPSTKKKAGESRAKPVERGSRAQESREGHAAAGERADGRREPRERHDRGDVVPEGDATRVDAGDDVREGGGEVAVETEEVGRQDEAAEGTVDAEQAANERPAHDDERGSVEASAVDAAGEAEIEVAAPVRAPVQQPQLVQTSIAAEAEQAKDAQEALAQRLLAARRQGAHLMPTKRAPEQITAEIPGGASVTEQSAIEQEAGQSMTALAQQASANSKPIPASNQDRDGSSVRTDAPLPSESSGKPVDAESGSASEGSGARGGGGRAGLEVLLASDQSRPSAKPGEAVFSIERIGAGAIKQGPTTLGAAARGGEAGKGGAGVPADQATAAVTRGLSAAVLQRGGSLTLTLTPESLGQVRIEMTLERGTVAVRMEAGTSAAQDLLESSMGTLRSSLESKGLAVERMSVHLAPGAASAAPSGAQAQDQPDARGQGGERSMSSRQDAGDGASRGRDQRDAEQLRLFDEPGDDGVADDRSADDQGTFRLKLSAVG